MLYCYKVNNVNEIETFETTPQVISELITVTRTIPRLVSSIRNNNITDISYTNISTGFTNDQQELVNNMLSSKNILDQYKNFINANSGFTLININVSNISTFINDLFNKIKLANPLFTQPITNIESSLLELSSVVGTGSIFGLYTMVNNEIISNVNTIQILFANDLIKNNSTFVNILETLVTRTVGRRFTQNEITDIKTLLNAFLTGLNQNTSKPEIRFGNIAMLLVHIAIVVSTFAFFVLFEIININNNLMRDIFVSIFSEFIGTFPDNQCNFTRNNQITFTPNICGSSLTNLPTTLTSTVIDQATSSSLRATINNNTITNLSYTILDGLSIPSTMEPVLQQYINFVNANSGFTLVNINLSSMKTYLDELYNKIKLANPSLAQPNTAIENLLTVNNALNIGSCLGLYTMVNNSTSNNSNIQILFANDLIKNNSNFISILRTLFISLEPNQTESLNYVMSIINAFLTGLNRNTSNPQIRFANIILLLVQISIVVGSYIFLSQFNIMNNQTLFLTLTESILTNFIGSFPDDKCNFNRNNEISFTPDICTRNTTNITTIPNTTTIANTTTTPNKTSTPNTNTIYMYIGIGIGVLLLIIIIIIMMSFRSSKV